MKARFYRNLYLANRGLWLCWRALVDLANGRWRR